MDRWLKNGRPPVSRRIWCSTVPLTYWEWEEVSAGRWRIRLHHSWSKSICRTGGGLQSWQMAPRCFNGFEKKKYTLLPLWADTLFLHKATRTGEYMVTHLGPRKSGWIELGRHHYPVPWRVSDFSAACVFRAMGKKAGGKKEEKQTRRDWGG